MECSVRRCLLSQGCLRWRIPEPRRRSTQISQRRGRASSSCDRGSTPIQATSISTSTERVTIPTSLEASVAVLSVEREGVTTYCYLLGVSHVSRVSCQQVSDLIDAVVPDVVCLELSKDRVGLLVDRDRQDSQTWQARKISIIGSTFSDEWPDKKEVLSLIKTKKGVPIQIQDIEADILTLLSTGLFSRGRPVFSRADETEAPAFSVRFREGGLEVQTIPPLGGVDFEMRDRSLPPIIDINLRVDSSLKEYHLDQKKLEDMASEAINMSKEGSVSLKCYLTLRKSVLDYCKSEGAHDAVTIFRGEAQGKTEVIVRSRRETDPPLVTGFEEGAEGGYGWGIEPFRPANRPFKLSEKMMIPTKILQSLTGNDEEADQDPLDAKATASLIENLRRRPVTWREWTENESPLMLGDEQKRGIAEYFGVAVTSLYGKFQGDAGRKVGVDPGAAWRTAMTASLRNAVSQIQLFDVPEQVRLPLDLNAPRDHHAAQVSQKRIAESIFAGMGARFALAAAYSLSVATLAQQSWFPDSLSDNSLWLALAGCAVLLWPVLGPFAEIAWLSVQSADQIEEAVKVKAPIQSDIDSTLKLFGEDALLDWPGAMDPIINQRDKYMARNLFMAATQMSSGAPAYVPDMQGDQVFCRFVMPENNHRIASPLGTGDGLYFPIQNVHDHCRRQGCEQRIVAIVGTAHVRGMCKEWERLKTAQQQPWIEEFLS